MKYPTRFRNVNVDFHIASGPQGNLNLVALYYHAFLPHIYENRNRSEQQSHPFIHVDHKASICGPSRGSTSKLDGRRGAYVVLR